MCKSSRLRYSRMKYCCRIWFDHTLSFTGHVSSSLIGRFYHAGLEMWPNKGHIIAFLGRWYTWFSKICSLPPELLCLAHSLCSEIHQQHGFHVRSRGRGNANFCISITCEWKMGWWQTCRFPLYTKHKRLLSNTIINFQTHMLPLFMSLYEVYERLKVVIPINFCFIRKQRDISILLIIIIFLLFLRLGMSSSWILIKQEATESIVGC
jgi:hypothetical protein